MDGESKTDMRVCICVNQQVCALIVRCAFGGKWSLNLVHFPMYCMCLSPSFCHPSHTSCNNTHHKHSPEWLTFLILSPYIPLFLRPCLLSLGVLYFLPILLTQTNQNTHLVYTHSQFSWRPSSLTRVDLFTQCLKNTHVVSQSVRLQYMLTHPQSNRKRAVCSTCRPTCNLLTRCVHVHVCVRVCVCVCAGVGGVYKDTLESFTPAV